MTALYCEIDPFAAAWLRELIKAGQIAPGDVTETPLEDLLPHDVARYTQVHLCAGIGVWSYALRNIGWPDGRRIWSASFPCQPFSAAGKGLGFADERHLWPLGLHLIQQCKPDIIVGEQVASKDGLAWFDVVQADLEASGYAVGAVDLCAAGVGAPHIRQRLWWVGKWLANADQQQRDRGGPSGQGRRSQLADGCGAGGLDHHHHTGLEGQRGGHQAEGGRVGTVRPVAETGELGGLADTDQRECRRVADGEGRGAYGTTTERQQGHGIAQSGGATAGLRPSPRGVADGAGTPIDDRLRDLAPWSGAVKGHWGTSDWIYCRDGKWRPVGPGAFPLLNGAPARVGRLRGYGNAIVSQAAEEFLMAALLDEAVNIDL